MSEKLEVSNVRFLALADGREVPFARITRDDGKPRTHHPRCPWKPGAPLAADTVCCDCIYGVIAEREEREGKAR